MQTWEGMALSFYSVHVSQPCVHITSLSVIQLSNTNEGAKYPGPATF